MAVDPLVVKALAVMGLVVEEQVAGLSYRMRTVCSLSCSVRHARGRGIEGGVGVRDMKMSRGVGRGRETGIGMVGSAKGIETETGIGRETLTAIDDVTEDSRGRSCLDMSRRWMEWVGGSISVRLGGIDFSRRRVRLEQAFAYVGVLSAFGV